ncbi:MAG: HK97 family phage prohead protease [Planctomycetota bacterium]
MKLADPNAPQHLQKYLDAASRLLDPRHREIEPASGDLGFSLGQVRSVNEEQRTIEALVSTPAVDRYEEIVEPKAFEAWLPVFEANPVFVAGHTYSGWNGEPTVLGSWKDMKVTEEGLVGVAEFDDEDPLARRHWNLYRKRHMRAFSVGWLTHSWEIREFELAPGVTKKLRVFTEVELIEISAVSIPANREALVRAAGIGGLATSTESSPELDAQGLAKALTPAVESVLTQLLSVEPGGHLCTLLQDVVELCMARAANGGSATDVLSHAHGVPGTAAGFDDELRSIFTTPTN